MFLNSLKLELIKKIINAKLTKAELAELTRKAETLIDQRNATNKDNNT